VKFGGPKNGFCHSHKRYLTAAKSARGQTASHGIPLEQTVLTILLRQIIRKSSNRPRRQEFLAQSGQFLPSGAPYSLDEPASPLFYTVVLIDLSVSFSVGASLAALFTRVYVSGVK
jgi:hypothetical protein